MKKILCALVPLLLSTLLHAANPVPHTEGVSFSFRLNGTGWATMSVFGEGTSTVSHSTSGSLSESGLATAWLRPGEKYQVTFSGDGSYEYWLSYVPPQGYALFIDNFQTDLSYGSEGGSFSRNYVIELRPLGDLAQAPLGEFQGVQMGKSISWEIGLGTFSTGRSAGRLYFKELDLSSDPAARSKLYYMLPGNYADAWVIRDGPSSTQLRQIIVPQGVVDVLDDSSGGGGYWIRFFLHSQSEGSPGNPNILYGAPWKTIRIESPGANQLRITETEGSAVRVSLVTAAAESSGSYTWTLQEGGPSNNWLRTTTHTSTSAGGYRDVVAEVRTGDSSGAVVSKTKFRYQNIGGWGEELVKLFAYPTATTSDAAALVTTYDYHVDSNARGNYRRIKSVTQPDGSWVARSYYDEWDKRGQLQYEFRPFVDAPATPSLDPGVGRVTSFNYGPNWTGRFNRLTLRQEHVNGTMTGQTGVANDNIEGTGWPREFSNIFPWSGSAAWVFENTEVYRADSGYDYPGLPYVHKRADLSQVSHSYSGGYWDGTTFSTTDGIGWWRELSLNGSRSSADGAESVSSWGGQEFSPIYLVAGKSTMDALIRRTGLPIRRETYVYTGAGAFALIAWENITYDDQWRVTQVQRSNGALTNYTYANGRLASTTDAAGLVTQFSYDALGRVTAVKQIGVASQASPLTTGYSYPAQSDRYTYRTLDGAGRVLQEIQSASATKPTSPGAATDLFSSAAYDLAGRPISQTAPGNYTTNYAYELGGRKVTTTLPGNATRITEAYLDGSPKSVTGTAVVEQNHTYWITAAGCLARQSVTGNNWSAWTNTYFDWFGRPIQEDRPGWDENAVARTWHYNNLGQLWKTTVPGINPTLYVYDSHGVKIREGLDVGNNGTLDLASLDRIVETGYSYFIDASNRAVRQTTTRTYATANSATATTLSTSTELLTNLGANTLQSSSVTDTFGNVSSQTTVVDRANKRVVTTVDHPNSEHHSIAITLNGLSVEQQDSLGARTRIEYDSVGRPIKRIDARTSAYPTLTAYVANTSQIDKVTDGAGNEVATYTYDAAGRVSSVKDAAGKFTYTSYTARGEIHRQWGSATHPIEYSYNGDGQRLTLTTYASSSEDFGTSTWPTPAAASAQTTTWTYHAASRLLVSKKDALQKTVSYTYDQAGRVTKRTWARGATTDYTYSASTGELTKVFYSGQAPTVEYAYNRQGLATEIKDGTGTRSLSYLPSGLLDTESLDDIYFGKRVLQQKTDDTTGAVGRNTGFMISLDGTPEYNLTYTYDSSGRFKSTADFIYTYVANSPLVDQLTRQDVNYVQSRTYLQKRDLLAAVSTSVGGFHKATFNYDPAGDGSGYDAVGRRTQVRKTGTIFEAYGDGSEGLTTRWSYNDRSELTQEETRIGTSNTVLSGRADSYAYDQLGNRAATNGTTHNGSGANYTTDAANRYTARTVPGVVDVAGAAAAASDPVTVEGSSTGVVRHGRYFFKPQPLSNASAPVFTTLSITSASQTQNLPVFLPRTAEDFSYDDDGNLTRDGRWVYVWDAENRLIAQFTRGAPEDPQVSDSEPSNDAANTAVWGLTGFTPQRLEFAYDYLGRRVRSTVKEWNGITWVTTSDLKFVYDGWNLVLELNAATNNTKVRSHVWGLDLSGSLQGAGGVGGLLYTSDHVSFTTLLPVYDGNGNILAYADAYGTTVARFEYDAFGQTVAATGPRVAAARFRFSTKYTDTETGLIYYGLRYYSPSLGRFINRDPIEERGGLNLYCFVRNGSVNSIDYIGLSELVFAQTIGVPGLLNVSVDFKNSNEREDIGGETYGKNYLYRYEEDIYYLDFSLQVLGVSVTLASRKVHVPYMIVGPENESSSKPIPDATPRVTYRNAPFDPRLDPISFKAGRFTFSVFEYNFTTGSWRGLQVESGINWRAFELGLKGTSIVPVENATSVEGVPAANDGVPFYVLAPFEVSAPREGDGENPDAARRLLFLRDLDRDSAEMGSVDWEAARTNPAQWFNEARRSGALAAAGRAQAALQEAMKGPINEQTARRVATASSAVLAAQAEARDAEAATDRQSAITKNADIARGKIK